MMAHRPHGAQVKHGGHCDEALSEAPVKVVHQRHEDFAWVAVSAGEGRWKVRDITDVEPHGRVSLRTILGRK